MGMDVYGKSPVTERGEYFRNNVWWWRPLWSYCCEVAFDIISQDVAEAGQYNDGQGLNGVQAKALGEKLFIELWEGRTAQYAKDYMASIADLPREPCNWCNSTGIRSDEIGIEHGWPNKELEPEVQILTGRTHGSCNGCAGIGTVENWAASYPFSIDNVANFATFCIESGGFEIC
jgi:hypothetical protein